MNWWSRHNEEERIGRRIQVFLRMRKNKSRDRKINELFFEGLMHVATKRALNEKEERLWSQYKIEDVNALTREFRSVI